MSEEEDAENILEARRKYVRGDIKDEGGGYRSLVGCACGPVAYIELPEGHPDIGRSYDDLDPDVNGGLTYARGRVFGWDYAHFDNDFNISQHIENALKYFRARAKP
jgi:hypothetical protein